MVGKGKQDALGGLPRTCADLRASQEREVVQDADAGEVGHLFGGQHHAKPAFGGKVTAGAGDEVLKGQDGSMAGSGTGGDWRKGVFTKKGRIGQDDVETLVTLPSAQVGLYNIYYRGKGGTPHILTGLAYSLRIYFHTHNVLRATLGCHQGKDAGAGAHVEYGEGGRLRRKNRAVSAGKRMFRLSHGLWLPGESHPCAEEHGISAYLHGATVLMNDKLFEGKGIGRHIGMKVTEIRPCAKECMTAGPDWIGNV